MQISGRFSFADARQIALDALQLLRPPTREGVEEFTSAHRRMPAKTGTGFVPWDDTIAPYLIGPMRALNGHTYLTVAIAGPGQSGKTVIGENFLLYTVAKQPRRTLYYMQTDAGVESFVKDRINTMIRAHEEMRSKLGSDPSDDTLHYKRFAGMSMQFLSATHNNLISKDAPLIIADEVDAYDQSFGDPKVLFDVRRTTYGLMSKLLMMSHPDLARGFDPVKHWRAGIMRVYADSDRRIWYWPCPVCGGWSSPAPFAKRVMTLEWPEDGTLDEIEAEAHLKCPLCDAKITDDQRHGMNLKGRWIGEGQEIAEDGTVTGELIKRDTAGFYIVGAMSPFLLKGIGGLARERVKAEREYEISGDSRTLKEVIVKQWGFPYAPAGTAANIEAEVLADRALSETYGLKTVPDGVRFLTAWADVQLAYFDVLVRGWGIDGESWIVDNFRVKADTAAKDEDWDLIIGELVDARYPLAQDPMRGMSIRAVGYDSGGASGTTERAYGLWRHFMRDRRVHHLGRSDGRDVWTLIPTKGASSPNAPLLSVVYPDTQRHDRKVSAMGTVPLALFNANAFKDSLNAQLQKSLPGMGYVHFAAALRAKEPPHVFFEQLVAEHRDADGRWKKSHQGVRNEALDKMVGTHVLAKLVGMDRVDWKHPPSWAAEWEKNSLVSAIDSIPTEKKPERSLFDILG
jgi:phage terminase large subunit GpA-like protein